jgi:hypothetical protein
MPAEKQTPPNLVTVFETTDEPEALVVNGLLQAEGIQALLTSLYLQEEIWPGVGAVAIRVAPERADDARRVIEEYRASPDADAEAEAEASGEPEAGPSPNAHPEKS